MNLTYKIKENGYEIYSDGALWITQYEPYIPNRSLSYEENAILQIEELSKPVEKPQDEKIIQLEQAMLEITTLLALEQEKNKQNEQAILELSMLATGGN